MVQILSCERQMLCTAKRIEITRNKCTGSRDPSRVMSTSERVVYVVHVVHLKCEYFEA
jgi:hypothetical protein